VRERDVETNTFFNLQNCSQQQHHQQQQPILLSLLHNNNNRELWNCSLSSSEKSSMTDEESSSRRSWLLGAQQQQQQLQQLQQQQLKCGMNMTLSDVIIAYFFESTCNTVWYIVYRIFTVYYIALNQWFSTFGGPK
jgi:hypothetical protein